MAAFFLDLRKFFTKKLLTKQKKTLKKINKLKEKLSDNPPPNKRTKDIKNQISELERKLGENDDLTIIY